MSKLVSVSEWNVTQDNDFKKKNETSNFLHKLKVNTQITYICKVGRCFLSYHVSWRLTPEKRRGRKISNSLNGQTTRVVRKKYVRRQHLGLALLYSLTGSGTSAVGFDWSPAATCSFTHLSIGYIGKTSVMLFLDKLNSRQERVAAQLHILGKVYRHQQNCKYYIPNTNVYIVLNCFK